MDVLVVTPTFSRLVKSDQQPRALHLARVGSAIQASGVVTCWCVVEDSDSVTDEVRDVLLGLPALKDIVVHLAHGPTNQYGNAQRGAGLQHLLDKAHRGMIVFSDDDNLYDPEYYRQIARAPALAVALAVGLLGPHGVELPYAKAGRVVGWDCGWIERQWPLDTAGFAVHTSLLGKLQPFETAGNGLIRSLEQRGEQRPARETAMLAEARRGGLYPDLAFGGETEFLEAIGCKLHCMCENVYAFHDAKLCDTPEALRAATLTTTSTFRYVAVSEVLAWYSHCRSMKGVPATIVVLSILEFYILAGLVVLFCAICEIVRGPFRTSQLAELWFASHSLNVQAAYQFFKSGLNWVRKVL